MEILDSCEKIMLHCAENRQNRKFVIKKIVEFVSARNSMNIKYITLKYINGNKYGNIPLLGISKFLLS